ncbi:MAG: FecR domain-containing protein [Proteobacteria bacterium]|nr:FecR domain-containing protein [Pseudomonadota bacterium]
MKKKIFFGIAAVSFLFLAISGLQAFSNADKIGKVIVKKKDVFIERNGKDTKVSGFGTWLQTGDTVKTSNAGNALIRLTNGDSVFLAQNARLTVETPEKKSKISRLIMKLYGKIRAQIQKTKNRNVRFATPNAVIGVKGTDFVVEYSNRQTSVATLNGLVNLQSSKNQKSIDVPPGKMCSISAGGEVMPLTEIAGDILKDVDFAGEKMEGSDISGEKVKF